jgi:hypothetical protein
MRDVPLSPGIPGGKWARLRPLCGHDEAFIDHTGTADVVTFIDRLLTPAPGTTVKPGCASDLTVADCDRLCAAIYKDYFGDRIEGRVSCRSCSEPFEMTFSLAALLEQLSTRDPQANGPDEQGLFRTTDGRRFRLPTAGEQRELTGAKPDEAVARLLERCVVDGNPHLSPEVIERAMEQIGALLDLDLDASCPHCGAVQAVRFDMPSYLFHALGYEKQFLIYEVHRISTTYGWAYSDTLSLPREDRRKFVRLIESERSTRRRSTSWPGI